MSRTEAAFPRRWSGARIALGSVAFGLAAALPLLVYIAFGPTDGNPIGLGLLAAAGMPFAVVGVFVGLVKMLVERFTREAD